MPTKNLVWLAYRMRCSVTGTSTRRHCTPAVMSDIKQFATAGFQDDATLLTVAIR